MNPATIVLMVGWLLVPGAAPLASEFVLAQTTPAQPASQPSTAPAAATPMPPPIVAPKPCPATSQGASQPDKSTQPGAAASASGPTPNVVYNGNTTEPLTDISPDVSPQQASQQRGRTTWLLGKTNENLKTLAGRRLSATQHETVDQIKRYVEESEAATKAGNLQRAYTLANKARMLSGDLVKH
jgi:hypothetical protein